MFIGTPAGKIEKIAGVDVYVSIPTGEYDKEKALLYLPGLLTHNLVEVYFFLLIFRLIIRRSWCASMECTGK